MKKTLVLVLGLLLVFAAPAFAAGQLSIFMWSEYMDPEIITAFEKEYDIKVRLDYYESNEEMVAKLQHGGLGLYDIIVPSTYTVASLRNLDLIEPLNHELLPNIQNLDPAFTAMTADPGNEYTVPYQWGTSGLGVRATDISQVKKSFAVLFDPAAEVGPFVVFDTARDAIGSALKYLGYSMNSTNPKELEEASRLLVETKKRPAFIGFDGGVGGLNKVMSGVARAAQIYNGEGIRAMDEDPQLHYFLPEEGGEIWTDLIAVPRRAPNSANAHAFINYLMTPEVAAQLATYNRYATPVAAAKPFIPESDLANPVMYPSPETLRNFEYLQDLGPANRLYDEAWTLIKTR
ncbi:spermidine/putrescine ABC transporter substrate-binding protein [Deltaproteobacteria bacterium OttesenSCG-928-M10]|nr:spermidine/putrescine ABC transporter substrate-binding protein [Deltaproteobacteria bacterium OttesenSCG-928-M10]